MDIVLCPECKGLGHHVNQECVDYHKSEWITEYICCLMCKGKGRMQRTETLTVLPDVEVKPNAGQCR